MAVVTFDPALFKLAYPAFQNVDDALLQIYFDQAGLYLSNTDCSPVQDIPKRTQLLWMLTAHIAYMQGALNPTSGGGNAFFGGRVNSATEGSVSVSAEMFPATGSSAWFNWTPYGAAFWQATLSLRSFRYRARPTVVEGQYGSRFWRQ